MTSIQNLEQLKALKTMQARRGVNQIELRFSAPPPFAADVESDINKSLRSCGCDTGALFVAAGLMWLAINGLLDFGFRWSWHWAVALKALGLLLALAAFGKLVGLAASELRLRSAIRQIEDFYANSQRGARIG
jgi:hypothetical protein